MSAAAVIRTLPRARLTSTSLATAARISGGSSRSCVSAPCSIRLQSTIPRRAADAVPSRATAFGDGNVASSVFAPLDNFEARHLGPRDHDVDHMLEAVGYKSMDDFIADAVPPHIRLAEDAVSWDTIKPMSESELLRRGQEIASMNKVHRSFIGMGYHNALVPPVILRNVLENPAWYTSYTPYQPEISQGRLESLVNFQTMVKSLTGLDIANASLLDEGTAAAEAMILAYGHAKSKKKTFLVDSGVLPQTLAVLRQRAKGFGINVVVTELQDANSLPKDQLSDACGVLVQYPDVDGRLIDWADLAKQVKSAGAMMIAATDLLALTMIRPPGEWGADVALGNSARFGVPPGYGGPHAAFFAVSKDFQRKIPGRLVGLSRDQQGKPAYRLALQTREQHIRREKATSNICTAQALLANMSAMYAVYHGPEGLRKIAAKTHALTRVLKHELTATLGLKVLNEDGAFFDTLTVDGVDAAKIHSQADQDGINLRRVSDSRVGITLDETVTMEDLTSIINVFASAGKSSATSYEPSHLLDSASKLGLDIKSLGELKISSNASSQSNFDRTSSYLTQEIFNKHRSETQMLRYIHHLQSKDLSLVHAMIPLGSCTMKLNATSSMMLLSKAEFGALHPFAPQEQARGYEVLIKELSDDLCAITGFPAVSLQPNSGAQGEFAGLSVIRAYLDGKGEQKRNVCLIPGSAHGTNPASAIMAGMRVVAIKNKDDGTLDLDDLKAKAEKHSEDLAAFMVTYPSTYGVFESGIQDACEIIHKHGGQVYMDGANLQAQVGLTNPAIIGADVTHLNLHKTFSIPHGGGGPGVGPICCASHLAPYLPGHPLNSSVGGGPDAIEAISAAPHGSASILTISWAYIKQLGWQGLRNSSAMALLAANYMAVRLAPHYKLRYTNEKDRVAHEFLLDLASLKEYVTVADVAKRLSDYGFHAPTCSWPISTGLLIEPTESESLEELDRFCEAMISIRKEIQALQDGKGNSTKEDNLLKNAPHTVQVVSSDEWTRPYSRSQAAYPAGDVQRLNKFWPASGRLDDVHGDQNLICECGSVDQYAEQTEGATATRR